MPLAFRAAPKGDRCSCGNAPEEVTKGFLRLPGKDVTQEQHQENSSSLPPSASLAVRSPKISLRNKPPWQVSAAG